MKHGQWSVRRQCWLTGYLSSPDFWGRKGGKRLPGGHGTAVDKAGPSRVVVKEASAVSYEQHSRMRGCMATCVAVCGNGCLTRRLKREGSEEVGVVDWKEAGSQAVLAPAGGIALCADRALPAGAAARAKARGAALRRGKTLGPAERLRSGRAKRLGSGSRLAPLASGRQRQAAAAVAAARTTAADHNVHPPRRLWQQLQQPVLPSTKHSPS